MNNQRQRTSDDMIWINISNILTADKFSGIVRTEYELCSYAYECHQKGQDIRFSTYQENLGFIEIKSNIVYHHLQSLKHTYRPPVVSKKVHKRLSKLKRSITKRLNKIKKIFGTHHHCFSDGDIVISVGQRLGSNEMSAFIAIKHHTKLQLRTLCHDILPINDSRFFDQHHATLFHQYIQNATIATDFFYCNSNFTKSELTDYYHKNNLTIPPMQVITLGCDLQDEAKTITNDNSVNELIKEPYLLFVSTIEIRKNHQLIYDMYLQLLEQGITNLPKIYFVGRRGWKVDELLHQLDNDKRIKDKIVVLNDIDDNQLLYLYKNCWFTVYPSLNEGYGLPVVESLSMGKYCLSSNAGSLPEAGGEFVDYINPYELDSWCEKFLFLINNPDYITQKEQYIKNNYHPTSWEDFAKNIIESELQPTVIQNNSQKQSLSQKSHGDKIKIAFVHDTFPCGGAEVVTSMLAVELAKKDYETYVFVRELNHELLTEDDKKHIKCIQVTWDDLYNPFNYNNTIIQTSNKNFIDIVVFVTSTIIDIQGINRGLKCKTIFAYHGTPFWEVEDRKQTLLRKRNKNIFKKLKYTQHKIQKYTQNEHRIVKQRLLDIYYACDAFTALCNPYQTILTKELGLPTNNKLSVITNAILPAKIDYNLNKKKQLLYMGRMTYADKRIDRLINIWKNIYQKFPDWEFLVVGDGPERQNLEKQAQDYRLERITFCGSTNKPYEYYNHASILCLSSHFESFGLVLAEAQQAGVIPIAFNCSAGVASVLSPNWENGVLIDDFSMQEYENALCKLMSDENLRQQIQQNILNKAKEYDIVKVGEMWHQLFNNLLM